MYPLALAKNFKCISKCRIGSCGMNQSPQNWTSGVTLQCILGMTIVKCHFCFQLWWVCTAINFTSNLGYFLAVKQGGKVLYLCILEFLAVKQVGRILGSKTSRKSLYLWMLEFLAVKLVGKVYIYACHVSKAPYLTNVEILILYVLSNDDS